MRNWRWVGVRFKTGLGGVGGLVRAVDEHVVPRLVSFWLGLIGLIPGFVGLAGLINRDNDAFVTIPFVSYDLPREEQGLRGDCGVFG